MAHYARVNGLTHKVEKVIICDEDFVESLSDKDFWIKTSYNTIGGVHYDPETGEPSADQTKALRYNYAGIGYTYDAAADAFIPPKPDGFDSWTLDTETYMWEAPVEKPTDGIYAWNEEDQTWDSRDA